MYADFYYYKDKNEERKTQFQFYFNFIFQFYISYKKSKKRIRKIVMCVNPLGINTRLFGSVVVTFVTVYHKRVA